MTITFTIEDLCDINPPKKVGGKMPARDIQNLLNKSYDPEISSYDGYEIDPELSGERVQVYKKKGTNEAVVVHRGTKGIHDWGNDLKLVLGSDLKDTARYKHADKIQKQAEAKYGAENVTTLGHSLGSKLASDVGRDSKEVITYNKPSLYENYNANPKETTIRTQYDPVSILLPNKTSDIFTIPSTSFNPLKEHSPDAIGRIDGDTLIGKGHVRKLSKKHLKDIIKKLPKKKGESKYKVAGKKKSELVDYCCSACAIHD
jgi:hypothetical protein